MYQGDSRTATTTAAAQHHKEDEPHTLLNKNFFDCLATNVYLKTISTLAGALKCVLRKLDMLRTQDYLKNSKVHYKL